VHLFERDCSIQRRHQKEVEEAPAPGITAALRAATGRAACEAARTIGYVGAGTVEFICEGDAFHLMEMNTRLQVEHPVTDAITGLDLMEWQLRVAAGEPLPLGQEQLRITGHAIEMRLYAEDPARDFVPSVGTLRHLALPVGEGIRVDAGVRAGDVIPIHYDPMIAKIIAHGADREIARRRLLRALEATEVAGVVTNLSLLRAMAAHPAFAAAELDTGFIAHHAAALLAPVGDAPREALAAAVFRLLRDELLTDAADPHSPWGLASAWRLNGAGWQDFRLLEGEARRVIRAHLGAAMVLDLPGGAARIEGAAWHGDDIAFGLDGRRHRARVLRADAAITVILDGVTHELRHDDPRAAPVAAEAAGGRVVAPMPGRVLQLLVAPGDRVARGAVLLVMEAMKVQMRASPPRRRASSRRCAAPRAILSRTAPSWWCWTRPSRQLRPGRAAACGAAPAGRPASKPRKPTSARAAPPSLAQSRALRGAAGAAGAAAGCVAWGRGAGADAGRAGGAERPAEELSAIAGPLLMSRVESR
jgi:3-methylcrotonyl-CoA carboxylase alpha subunit